MTWKPCSPKSAQKHMLAWYSSPYPVTYLKPNHHTHPGAMLVKCMPFHHTEPKCVQRPVPSLGSKCHLQLPPAVPDLPHDDQTLQVLQDHKAQRPCIYPGRCIGPTQWKKENKIIYLFFFADYSKSAYVSVSGWRAPSDGWVDSSGWDAGN